MIVSYLRHIFFIFLFAGDDRACGQGAWNQPRQCLCQLIALGWQGWVLFLRSAGTHERVMWHISIHTPVTHVSTPIQCLRHLIDLERQGRVLFLQPASANEHIVRHISMCHITLLSHICLRQLNAYANSLILDDRGEVSSFDPQVHAKNLCHAYECVTWRIWMSHATHVNASCHSCEWVMWHIWMTHVMYINASCHKYEWVMSRIEWVMPHSLRWDDKGDICIHICINIYIW